MQVSAIGNSNYYSGIGVDYQASGGWGAGIYASAFNATDASVVAGIEADSTTGFTGGTAQGLLGSASAKGAITANELTALYAYPAGLSNGASATNVYGVKVGNQSVASVANYAVYTDQTASSTNSLGSYALYNAGTAPSYFNGNVGVATDTPWRKLSVTGTVGFDGLTGATGAGSLCLSADKEVVYNSGSDNCLSSLRTTKHDINNLEISGTSMVAALVPVSFVYNNDASSTVRYGFIAEDAAAVDSHFGTYDQAGKLSGVDDRSILSIIVKALQELIATVQGFAQKVTTKEADVGKLCVQKSDGTLACITGDQLTSMLASTGQSPSNPVQISAGSFTIANSSPSSNESTTTSTTTDTVIITASSTPPTSPPTDATTSAATSTTQ